ncbi:MAG: DUF5677 domain-containing protein [Acidobacteriota bacterium]
MKEEGKLLSRGTRRPQSPGRLRPFAEAGSAFNPLRSQAGTHMGSLFELAAHFAALTEMVCTLSSTTTGKIAENRRQAEGSLIFAKLCLHALAISRLLPAQAPRPGIWDLPSVCVLTRVLMETYYVFFYLCADIVNQDEENFRFALWQYHSEAERLRMLQTFGSRDPRLAELRHNVEQLKDRLLDDAFYKSLKLSQRRRLRNGERGLHLTNAELSARARIEPNYYRSVYKLLSQYVHTYSFSISQIAAFRADDPQSEIILATGVDVAVNYLGLAIRDFVTLFPSTQPIVEPVGHLVKLAEERVKATANKDPHHDVERFNYMQPGSSGRS